MGIGGMTFTGSMMRSIDLALGGRASQAKDFEVRDLIIRDVDLRLTGQKVVAKTEKKKIAGHIQFK
jgi:hypothetical protein